MSLSQNAVTVTQSYITIKEGFRRMILYSILYIIIYGYLG